MPSTDIRYFDLNIGEILEGWQPRHAVRELIANALDEETLTGTAEVEIAKTGGTWRIRDHGRGLRHEHLTQNESDEKLANPSKVIGKFGVGLKDALATLHRHGIVVEIRSPHCGITITERGKHGFDELATLHAAVAPPSAPRQVGTEVILDRLDDSEMETAKQLFLRFSGEQTVGETPYGQILARHEDQPARIYVNGLRVAEEEDFVFSYNITSLTATMRKALNRERTNVGRAAFSERVKSMLLACSAPAVAATLAEEIAKLDEGQAHDEVKWTDVAVHACRILSQTSKVVFVSSDELANATDAVDHARSEGYQMVTLPRNIREKLRGERDASGAPVRGLDVFVKEWSRSFRFEFVEEAELRASERAIFARQDEIAALVGGWPRGVVDVLVSNTMRPGEDGRVDALGLWDPANRRIIIRRDQLRSIESFAGTLIHEIAHAESGAGDVTRMFEDALTGALGTVATLALRKAARPARPAKRRKKS